MKPKSLKVHLFFLDGKSTAIIIKMSKCHQNYFTSFYSYNFEQLLIFAALTLKLLLIMKTRFFTILTIAAMTLSLSSCKDKAKEAKTTEAEAATEMTEVSTKYKVNTEASSIKWIGHKPTGSHNGTISLESGIATANNGTLESGTFLIDMSSINVLDIPADDEGNAKLAGHLKSSDFFDVEKYPAAAFEVTGFETVEGKTMLSGNLKLKDVTNNISIPVTVKENGDTLSITSETFTINRSKWNVKYGSKSFFDDLGDKFINDDIELQIDVTATKA